MCGIVGFIDRRGQHCDDTALVARMASQLSRRGPDAEGAWASKKDGVALGHRRLAIVDLSENGRQPMWSQNDHWVMVYNGEIYNFLDIRLDLEQKGVQFVGNSDSEVLLEAVAFWGIEKTLTRINGIFSIALYNMETKHLFLIRDRLGVKPLYFGVVGGTLFFGSELKAFRPHPNWHPELSTASVCAYIRGGYMPSNQCIWKDMSQVNPGTFVHVDTRSLLYTKHVYWDVSTTYEHGFERKQDFDQTDEEAIEHLEALLNDAVKRQLVSDVPLGAFLSGGIDSSLVAAFMQSNMQKPAKTFSIGFQSEKYNEAHHAKKVAEHLGTEHTELYVTPQAALDIVPKLTDIYDEPFADSSQIPTFLVSQLASQDVTVALSGDGGDEMFGGYSRYTQVLDLIGQNHGSRALAWKVISQISQVTPVRLLDFIGGFAPKQYRRKNFGRRFRDLAVRASQGPQSLYLSLISQYQIPSMLVVGGDEPRHPAALEDTCLERSDILSWMQKIDSVSYLPGDILTKVDRASMAVGLEARVPLLDHRIFEYACTLPNMMKMRDQSSKWLLRQVLYKYVPKELIDRPKMGFGVPIDEWLRGPLKEWAWSRLNPDTIKKHNVLESEPIQNQWKAHQDQTANFQYPLWTALILQDWLERESTIKNSNN